MDHQKLMQELIDFRNSRGWDEAHSLPNLAKSVNIEAAEILEIFQWKKTSDELSEDEKTHLKGEIADTLIYLFYMCDRLNVDPIDVMKAKLEYNKGREWDWGERRNLFGVKVKIAIKVKAFLRLSVKNKFYI